MAFEKVIEVCYTHLFLNLVHKEAAKELHKQLYHIRLTCKSFSKDISLERTQLKLFASVNSWIEQSYFKKQTLQDNFSGIVVPRKYKFLNCKRENPECREAREETIENNEDENNVYTMPCCICEENFSCLQPLIGNFLEDDRYLCCECSDKIEIRCSLCHKKYERGNICRHILFLDYFVDGEMDNLPMVVKENRERVKSFNIEPPAMTLKFISSLFDKKF